MPDLRFDSTIKLEGMKQNFVATMVFSAGAAIFNHDLAKALVQTSSLREMVERDPELRQAAYDVLTLFENHAKALHGQKLTPYDKPNG